MLIALATRVPAPACDVGQRWGRCRRGSGAIVFADCANSARSGWRWLQRPKGPRGFAVLPWRWIVECTFAWLGRSRRLKSHYESLPHSTEALIHIAMIRLMLQRLEPICPSHASDVLIDPQESVTIPHTRYCALQVSSLGWYLHDRHSNAHGFSGMCACF
jgi:hypothetical protein